MKRERVRNCVNQYCVLRDLQFSVYDTYARKYSLTAKELFVLDILWFAPEDAFSQKSASGCLPQNRPSVQLLKSSGNWGMYL